METQIYLSRLILNPHSRQVRRDIGDCHQLHRTVMNAFPQLAGDEQKDARQKLGVLHRLEIDGKRGSIVLIVQSSVEPDWNKLPEDYLTQTDAPNPAYKSIGQNLAAIADGTELMFRLRANPTKRVGKNDSIAAAKFKDPDKRRRVEIYGEIEQTEWLKRKGADAGFYLSSVRVNPSVSNANAQPGGKIYGRRLVETKEDLDAARREKLTFGAVVFEGVLTVTDSSKFKETLRNGIGQGKAYGFGLLSVARPLSF